MSHLALYREWRPQTFADVVGQQHVVTTLKNAIRYDKLAHAYLFSGPRGTGKTSLAKILAKSVNCESPIGVEPCNVCPSCVGIMNGRIVDVVEMDAASNRGVDEIRGLLEQIRYAPTEVKRKVYIIDEVHMLTQEAFNALLKTLEEPPEYCLFVLATTEVHKIPATVVSRCQRFDLSRISMQLVVEHLQMVLAAMPECTVEDAALWFIARATEGGMRDALSLLDQIVSYGEGQVTIEQALQVTGGVASEHLGQIFSSMVQWDHASLLTILGQLWQRGTDPTQLVFDLLGYLRDGILVHNAVDADDAIHRMRYDPTFSVVVQQSTTQQMIRLGERLTALQSELRYQTQARLFVEVALLSMMDTVSETTIGAEHVLREEIVRLATRISVLEEQLVKLARQAKTDAPVVVSPEQVISASLEAPVQEKIPVTKSKSVPARGIVQIHSMTQADGKLLNAIQQKWNMILDEIKRQSVQGRAWLHGSQVVAVNGHQVIVTVKSDTHAKTLMKQYRELIDRVLSEHTGSQVTMLAVSEEDWKQIGSSLADTLQQTSDQPSLVERPSWVQNVVELFGEDRVTISEE